jgi:hypothetical protein
MHIRELYQQLWGQLVIGYYNMKQLWEDTVSSMHDLAENENDSTQNRFSDEIYHVFF